MYYASYIFRSFSNIFVQKRKKCNNNINTITALYHLLAVKIVLQTLLDVVSHWKECWFNIWMMNPCKNFILHGPCMKTYKVQHSDNRWRTKALEGSVGSAALASNVHTKAHHATLPERHARLRSGIEKKS